MKANFVGLQWNLYLYGSLNAVDMILSQEEREYIQLFKDMIVVLYADSDLEPLLTFCNQCITKEAEIFSSMSRHLEMMRKKNNDIQNAQYLKNVINGVIAMLGNENVILYDNIEQLDVQSRKQIKITLAIFDWRKLANIYAIIHLLRTWILG